MGIVMNKTSNKPAENIKGAGSPKKPAGTGMLIGIAVAVVVVIIAVLSLFMGGGDKKALQEKEKQAVATSDSASSGKKQTKVYETEKREIVPTNSRFDPNGQPANGDLTYYTDPVTNVQFVQTPNGPLEVDSPEGQQYIQNYASSQAANPTQQFAAGAAGNQAASLVATAEIESIKRTTNEQVMALDSKINDLSAQVDGLVSLAKKQNQTIESLAHQIKTIQPITKSSTELAKDLFGKNGDKVLKERNTALAVDSIIGNKAYISTKDGKTVLVGVGDIVPGTSVKVKKVDASTNTVLVAE